MLYWTVPNQHTHTQSLPCTTNKAQTHQHTHTRPHSLTDKLLAGRWPPPSQCRRLCFSRGGAACLTQCRLPLISVRVRTHPVWRAGRLSVYTSCQKTGRFFLWAYHSSIRFVGLLVCRLCFVSVLFGHYRQSVQHSADGRPPGNMCTNVTRTVWCVTFCC